MRIQIRAIASEFYEGLYEHKSWIWVLYQFIANPSIRLSSRIKRKPTTNQQFYDTNMTSNYFTEVSLNLITKILIKSIYSPQIKL